MDDKPIVRIARWVTRSLEKIAYGRLKTDYNFRIIVFDLSNRKFNANHAYSNSVHSEK